MRTVLSFITLLALSVSAILASPAHHSPSKTHGARSLQNNAKRLSEGLPPLAPRRLFSAQAHHLRRDPAPSGVVTPAPFTGGFATFYFQNGNAGACGQSNPDSSLIAALPETRFGYDYSKISPECGKRIKVTNTNNGRSVTVTVADSCPTCVNANSLDLSQGAFDQIASEADGMIPITWAYL
ncbi:hypothetical protein D9611_009002 [Ephemerocybe angulata]|uniref:RlpA-like protein double-psi beta-barrel domain-containing protein n=1 Tax=Ephemerocybe angulata TaxID=980116 RepID=A0A8H5BZ73_9AGAR|nr:hypothetical protein D9611_009002 [Tulosesus angulatus]